jgi:NitT/TauT family transport system substrate-binding protein
MSGRHSFFRIALGVAVAFAVPGEDASAQTKLRMVLDWKYQAQMGVFFLAADRGYLRDANLEVNFDQGEGSGAPAPKIASGAYDLGFGGIDSVVILNATRPADAPVAVFLRMRQSRCS